MNNKKWNNNLKIIRVTRGYTQKQLAELLGLQAEDRISHWEKGQSVPHMKNLIKLCKVLRVLPHEIYPEGLSL